MTETDARTIARQRLAARHRRFQRIRTRVAAGAAAVFIAVFGGLMIQLASGDDPGLASSGSSSGQATSAVVSTAASSSTEAQSSSDGTSSSGSTASQPAPSAVTTAQS